MTIWPLFRDASHTSVRCMLAKTLFNVVLLRVLLYLISASAGLTSWMTSELYSYVSLEVSYIFRKVPRILVFDSYQMITEDMSLF